MCFLAIINKLDLVIANFAIPFKESAGSREMVGKVR